MAADLFARLLLDNSNFESSIKKSRKSINDTNASFNSLKSKLGNITSTFGKVAGAVGVATTTFEAFNSAIRSNQTTSDYFDSTMQTVKTSVDEFFYSITTGDFSVFNNGLDNLISRAKDAYGAIDQLGNTLMSYNIIQAKAQSKITNAKSIISNPNATKEEIEQAKKDLKEGYKELKDASKVAIGDYQRAIQSEVEAKGNFKLDDDAAISIIDKMLEVDAKEGRENTKKIYEQQYKKYQKELEALYNKYAVTTGQSTSIGVIYGKTISNSKEYNKELAKVNKKYQEAIAFNTLIKKYNDEGLNNLGQQRVAMIKLGDEANNYITQMNRLNNKTNKQSSTVTPKFEAMPKWETQNIDINVTFKKDSLTQSIADIRNAIKYWENEFENAGTKAGREYAQSMILAFKNKLKNIDVPTTANEQLAEAAKNIDLSGLNNYIKLMNNVNNTTATMSDKMNEASNMIGNMGSAFSSLGKSFEDPALDVFGIIASSIANVMLGYSQATAQAASMGPWAWATFAVAGLAEVAAVVAQIHNLSGYASGGIVGGNSYHGDTNIVGLNSGEMVLNRNQQSNLWHLLDGGANKVNNTDVHFRISGRDLVGTLSNYNSKYTKSI